MSKWLEVVLDKICETITDGTHLTPPLAERGVPLYNGADINNMKIHNTSPSKFISRETDNVLATRCKPQGNDVLISSRGSIGKVAIVEEGQDFNIMGNIILCRPSQEKLLPWFLGYYFKGKQNKLEELAHGVAQKGLYLSIIRNLHIPLPPLETQKQIAKTLDTTTELLAMRKKQLKELDNLIKSTFYDMFGDPVTNEKGWDIVSIVDVCSEIVDCVNKTAPIIDGISPYKMLRTTNIKKGKVDTQNVNYVDEQTFQKWTRRSLPRRGDVLLTREAPIGETGIIESDENLFLGQRIVSYRVNGSIMHPLYLMYHMQSEHFEHQIRKLARGSTVKHLSVPECNLFEVYVPPLIQQNKFAEIVTIIEEQKALVKKAIDETQYLFDSLMSEYFE